MDTDFQRWLREKTVNDYVQIQKPKVKKSRLRNRRKRERKEQRVKT